MDQDDNTGHGSSSPQPAEAQHPVPQDVEVVHPPDTSLLDAGGNMRDDRTVTASGKPPEQPRKLPIKQDPIAASSKDFKEMMIQVRLDDWKIRAQIVHTPGQVDVTALWRPYFTGINSGMILFDGFDRNWFVPFDMNAPLPAGRQNVADDLQKRKKELAIAHHVRDARDKFFHQRLLSHFEDEAKETCQSQWEKTSYLPYIAPTQWEDVRETYELPDLARMIARARWEDGREQLPGYYRAIVLELGIDGKITYQHVSVPSDVELDGLVSRLESWYPHNEHSIDVLRRFRHKLDFVSEHGNEEQKRKIQAIRRQLVRMVETQGPDCEISQWRFRLSIRPDYSIPVGKSPDRLNTWNKMNGETYQELLGGVRVKKYPVFVRKIRIRRWWPELKEYEKQIETSQGELGLSIEQLGMVDVMLLRRTDEEKEQAAWSKQVLDMAKMALI
ncbi:hypothetical protein FLONG3_883 [Fusarium longipes]|uniref:Uncharacterized protein n=1 Tax=Fusarium longipes TaxID=694270 RepID=A0A395T8Y0_9HYPO|nr:hypothetical protein FLONG3_883 [Fusarium longipes]